MHIVSILTIPFNLKWPNQDHREEKMAVNFNVLFATWPGLCRFYDMCDKESNEYDYGQSS
jgi:hypothetical protein